MTAVPRELLDALRGLPDGCTLGLNYTSMHDSAIAVLGPDGAPRFACALERVTRTKQDGRWPAALLDAVPWDRIATLAISGLPAGEADALGQRAERADWPAHPRPEPIDLATFRYEASWAQRIAALPLAAVHFDHHEAHAASAWYLAELERGLIVTCDAGAYQCPWTLAAYRAHGDAIELVAGMHFRRFVAPTHLYTLVTALLGLQPNRHEGKVTGLAARGRITDADVARFEEVAWPMAEELGSLARWDMALDVAYAPAVIVNEARRLDWRRRFDWLDDAALAACVQRVAECAALALVRHARALAGGDLQTICLAGGLFANVRVNQAILADGFARGFVAPPMTDDGTALGAALLAHVRARRGASSCAARATMFLGPDIGAVGAEPALAQHGLRAERAGDLAARVADLLAEGRVVAVARGRMEFGPRALGHRSVLAAATDPGINDWLNGRLRRTDYMPFAPMLLAAHARALFAAPPDAAAAALRFMTVTVDCAEAFRAEAPAVVHVDGTARPQVLEPGDEPFCERVLALYHERTGRRAIVNTSFNVHEEPIACSAEDALVAFAQTRLDALVLGDALVLREANAAALDALAAHHGAATPGPQNLPTPLGLGRWLERALALGAELRGWSRELQQGNEWLRARGDTLAQRVAELEARLAQLEQALGDAEARSRSVAQQLAALSGARWTRLGHRLRLVATERGEAE